MGLNLFDDEVTGAGGSDDDDLNKIEIDKEFARRYKHNKKREDLQKLEELKKKGLVAASDDSESDSDEPAEEDGVELGKKDDLAFFDALIRIRNQDPILKNKEAKLFESESESQSDGEDSDKQAKEESEKKKPMYLKDVVSKHLIEEGPEFGDGDSDDENVDNQKVKSYWEEQEESRRAFLKAVEEAEAEVGEDGGEFLREKSRGEEEEDEEDVGIGKKIDEYFGEDEKLDEDMIFLKDYFRNRMWVGEDGDKHGQADGEGLRLEFSEDEEEIDRQEDYEREYNFRFEENAGDRVMGHSRVVEGSVRKKMNARKLQRERKEERMLQAEFERKEELKHLKNVKKKEMNEMLGKIKEAAGIGDDGNWLLDEDDLEEEFDPEQYDKKMKEAFDEEYYGAEDVDPQFGSEDDDEFKKPDFDKEDELLGLPEDWDDVNKSGDGFLSARERILKLKSENGGDGEPAEGEDVELEEGKRKEKRKRQSSEVEKAAKDQLMEEYYKLDYEDTIGDLKTRFKYRAVEPRRYGLTPEAILMQDDKELNQYVSLKKLAPYREKEWKVPRPRIQQQKQRSRELLQGEVSNMPKTDKKLRNNGRKTNSSPNHGEREKSLRGEVNGDTSNLSRGNKRKRRLAELKLSHSRLKAYGKIPSKPKSKKKS